MVCIHNVFRREMWTGLGRKRAKKEEKAKGKARGVIGSSRRDCVIHLLFPSWDREPSPVPSDAYRELVKEVTGFGEKQRSKSADLGR